MGFRNDPMLSLLRRLKVDPQDVEICPVDTDTEDGRAVYRRWHQIGQMRRWAAISLGVALQRRDKLIGFVYPDYSFRDDRDIVVHPNGWPELPRFVLLWKNGATPTRVAGQVDRRMQRPIVTR